MFMFLIPWLGCDLVSITSKHTLLRGIKLLVIMFAVLVITSVFGLVMLCWELNKLNAYTQTPIEFGGKYKTVIRALN